jgi:alkylated DNA repair dioxygenase AlkB
MRCIPWLHAGHLQGASTPRMASLELFPISSLPEGFLYQPEFLSASEEAQLLTTICALPFAAFDFHGYLAKRRIVEYGMKYDSSTRKATATKPFPDYLAPFRDRAAQFARTPPDSLVECIVTEYPQGAPIGWHRDAPQFEIIIGISLASSCRMRLKPYKGEGRLVSLTLEPRSIYMMSGPARWQFQHSIPAVAELRYSITFRTVRGSA